MKGYWACEKCEIYFEGPIEVSFENKCPICQNLPIRYDPLNDKGFSQIFTKEQIIASIQKNFTKNQGRIVLNSGDFTGLESEIKLIIIEKKRFLMLCLIKMQKTGFDAQQKQLKAMDVVINNGLFQDFTLKYLQGKASDLLTELHDEIASNPKRCFIFLQKIHNLSPKEITQIFREFQTSSQSSILFEEVVY